MADLLDIAPTTAVEVVKIGGQDLTVYSLGAHAIASLAVRFPQVIDLFFGGLNVADIRHKLIGQLLAAVGPIIAAGCGHLNEEKYEQHASTAFLLEDQVKLVVAVIGITFPNGLGFYEELMGRVKRFTSEADGEANKPIKVRSKPSPSPSQPSSDEASHPNMQ